MPLSKIKEEILKEFDNADFRYDVNSGRDIEMSEKIKAFLSASITKACEEMMKNLKLPKKPQYNEEYGAIYLATQNYQAGYLEAIKYLSKKQKEFFKGK